MKIGLIESGWWQDACGVLGHEMILLPAPTPVLFLLKHDEQDVQRCIKEGCLFEEIEVPVLTIDDVLLHERQHAPPDRCPWSGDGGWRIDLVSIDTEGAELDVLDGFNLDRFKPRVLVIENDRPANTAVREYLAGRGHTQFHRCVINDFYIRTADRQGVKVP